MPVSPKLTNEEFATLPDNVKGAYRVSNAGGYELDIPVGHFIDDQDPAALLNAKNYVNEENKSLKAKLAAIEDEKAKAIAEAEAAKAKKSGDFDAYRQQVDAQLEKIRQDHEAELRQRDESILQNTLLSTATQIASELSGDKAHFMAPIVRDRLIATMENGIPKIQVKDTLGNVALGGTVDSLKKELLTDPRNAPIIVQSKASGSGTPGSHPSSVTTEGKKYSDFNPAELSDLRKSDEATYQKLVAERDAEKRRVGAMPLGAKPI